MNTVKRFPLRSITLAVTAATALAWGGAAQAHCDTLDGPVVSEARKALDTGNPNVVLGWVQKKDETEIRNAFQKAIAVRKLNPAAKDLADNYFFETLVRIHRAGEGAPYTGLKPAGEIEPAIAAADKSIETGKLEPVARLVKERVEHGLHRQFESVAAKKKYGPNDTAAARAYVGAYVTYVHYVEGLYNAAATQVADDIPAKAAPAKPSGHMH